MIRVISGLASIFLVGCVFGKQPVPASEAASSKIRKAITGAATVKVHEGLPHQTFERDLLASESERKDIGQIGSFPFYTPAVAVTAPTLLKRILSSADTIEVFGGEKLCGGFHPDYAVQWSSEDGSPFFALICLGCHELIFSDGQNQYRYDIEDGPFEELKKELSAYAKKRPREKR